MQTFEGASRGLGELSARFEESWDELVRFVTSRKARSALYRGPAGDLSHAQLAALLVLDENARRMGDLALDLGLAESSVTRLVDRLEAAGLVERRASRPDRRSVVAGLTAKGRRVLGEVRENRRSFLREILETLDPSERQELVRLFGKVTQALRQREAGVTEGAGA